MCFVLHLCLFPLQPPGATEREHVAISENVMDAEKELNPLAGSELAQGTAKATLVGNEPEKPERPSVPLYHYRERTRGEKPSLRGPGQRLHYKPPEAPTETCCPLAAEGESRSFSRRPNWRKERGQWSCGRYNQGFPKSCSREQANSFKGGKELCTRSISPAKEGAYLRHVKHGVGKWTPEQETQAQDGEEDDVEVSRSELRAPAKWQDQHRMQDCRYWEKAKGRERGSYPRMPRSRGWYRPNARREPPGQEAEGSS